MKTNLKRALAVLICAVVAISAAFCLSSCKGDEKDETTTQSTTEQPKNIKVLGEGKTEFFFNVVDAEGKTEYFQIKTDKKIVGEALQELKLISGEEGEYGLYVKEVNGIIADYNTSGTYWAFYVGENSSLKGVDQTDIIAGETYAFKVEK